MHDTDTELLYAMYEFRSPELTGHSINKYWCSNLQQKLYRQSFSWDNLCWVSRLSYAELRNAQVELYFIKQEIVEKFFGSFFSGDGDSKAVVKDIF